MEGAANQSTTGTVQASPLSDNSAQIQDPATIVVGSLLSDSSAPIQQAVNTVVQGSPNPNSAPIQKAVDTVQGSLNGDYPPQALQAAPPLLVQPVNAVPPGAVIIYHVKRESSKRKRGRPSIFPAARVDGEKTPGDGQSDKKQKREASSSSGSGSTDAANVFTAHTLNVEPGEEISSKIMALTHNSPRASCVMSANGVISTVTLSQAATSGGTSTFEGRFEILWLRGTYVPSELAGRQTTTGGLTILLSAPDGEVIGGRVAGLLIAASPVQVIVGSFLPEGRKEEGTSESAGGTQVQERESVVGTEVHETECAGGTQVHETEST